MIHFQIRSYCITLSLLITICIIKTVDEHSKKFIFIDFNQGCHELLTHYHVNALEGNAWHALRTRYTNLQATFMSSHHALNQKIPTILHFIWLGPKPLPADFERFVEGWKKAHPAWKIIIWRDKDVTKLRLTNYRPYRKSKNFGERSDIARYEILYRFGGVYADTDFECLKSLEPLHELFSFYAGISYDLYGYLFNGLIGTVPNHPIMQYCIEKIGQTNWDSIIYDGSGSGILQRTGPFLLTEAFLARMNQDSHAIALPPCYFYSWPSFSECADRPYKYRDAATSYAIHHWHTAWLR